MDAKAMRSFVRDLFNVRKGRATHKVIRRRVVEGATIDGIHVFQLIGAMIIASIGLNTDSTEAVIGAMLICPLMGSVIAMAYAVATIDREGLRDAMVGILVQFGVCLLTSTIYFVLSPLSNKTSELLTNSTATVWDVLIAFVGGFAGALGLSRKQEPATLIAGVAVATALMPPLCTGGYGLAMRDLPLAAAALYEFWVNVVFIAFGAELVLVIIRVPLVSDLDGDGVVTAAEEAEAIERSRRMRHRLVVGSLIFAIPCLFFSGNVVRSTMEANGTIFEVRDTYETEYTTLELRVVCPELVSYRIGQEDSYDEKEQKVVQRVVATVETSSAIDETRQRQIEDLVRLNVGTIDDVSFVISET